MKLPHAEHSRRSVSRFHRKRLLRASLLGRLGGLSRRLVVEDALGSVELGEPLSQQPMEARCTPAWPTWGSYRAPLQWQRFRRLASLQRGSAI